MAIMLRILDDLGNIIALASLLTFIAMLAIGYDDVLNSIVQWWG